jgi:hypothetical protein
MSRIFYRCANRGLSSLQLRSKIRFCYPPAQNGSKYRRFCAAPRVGCRFERRQRDKLRHTARTARSDARVPCWFPHASSIPIGAAGCHRRPRPSRFPRPCAAAESSTVNEIEINALGRSAVGPPRSCKGPPERLWRDRGSARAGPPTLEARLSSRPCAIERGAKSRLQRPRDAMDSVPTSFREAKTARTSSSPAPQQAAARPRPVSRRKKVERSEE